MTWATWAPAACFHKMGPEVPAAPGCGRVAAGRVDTWDLARLIVTVIERAIMLTHTQQDERLMGHPFDHLKAYVEQSFQA